MIDTSAITPGKPFRIARATVPACLIEGHVPGLPDADGLVSVDIDVADGRIFAIAEAGATVDRAPAVDLDDGMVWPCFADIHTHLDKSHIWPRKRNPDGSRPSAIRASEEDRLKNWSADDVRARMEFSLRCAYAHGTAAIRTHIDSQPEQYEISWRVLQDVQAKWKDRIHLKGVSLQHAGGFKDKGWAFAVADTVKDVGGLLGAVLNIQDNTEEMLDLVIGLAIERDLDLDFHVDEAGDPNAKSFDAVAEALIRNRFGKRVNVGHCCALALRPEAEVARALDLAAEANMTVTSLPMVNQFLQDRTPGRTPRWRGPTVLHELKARGIPVILSSDNSRDPFFAYGDLDGIEVFSQAVRIGHLDYPVGDWPLAITTTPADLMGYPDVGRIRVGGPADLVLLTARDYGELIPRPQTDRVVLRGGVAIDTTPPDYRELDGVLGRA